MSLLLREAIGGSIRRARTERRRTLRDVSREARVSLGYLSEIERGRKEPSSELLAAICEALALSLPELLDDVADTMRPRPRRIPVDPALRSAVEEAFGPAGPVGPVEDAPAGASGPVGHADTSAQASAGPSVPASTPAARHGQATIPRPPEPEEPAAPRTIALPEPEGAPVREDGEELVAPVEGTIPGRVMGLVALPGASGVASTSTSRPTPQVRLAA